MLYGKSRLTLATLAIAVLVPLVNFLSVIVLIKISPLVSERSFWSALVWHLITNPLIIASGLGIFLNAVSWQLPIGIDTTISALGQATLPLGLLAVGAGMNGQTIRAAAIPRAWSNAFKLIAMPASNDIELQGSWRHWSPHPHRNPVRLTAISKHGIYTRSPNGR